MGSTAKTVYGVFGVIALPFFPQIVLIAWLIEKIHGNGDPRVTLANCAASVWDEWQREFWRFT